MDFSLFYFADDGGTDDYRLLLDGARFADTHGFTAVWTPERHFHTFGGPYPNPAVTGAAVAAVTDRVAIRAGSVVGPLHHPARIAEEWAVVDRLSGGRVGVSFASGWHAVDFALRPESYEARRELFAATIRDVRELWRGGTLDVRDGAGRPATIRTYPRPVQPELPFWVTSAGSVDTFRLAGTLGGGVLTHLLGQDPDDLRDKIGEYRAHLPDGVPGHVVLMLHTFLGPDRDAVRATVRAPFAAYLRGSIGLIARTAAREHGIDPDNLHPDDVDFLVERSVDRYLDTAGLFGPPADARRRVAELASIGVDEVACLIDFGVPPDDVLAALEPLAALCREAAALSHAGVDGEVHDGVRWHADDMDGGLADAAGPGRDDLVRTGAQGEAVVAGRIGDRAGHDGVAL